jgi:hypothetical protein
MVKIEAFCTKCKTWILSDKIKIEGISYNLIGQEIISFICPMCNTSQEGIVRVDG